jgi:hypothetical protein
MDIMARSLSPAIGSVNEYRRLSGRLLPAHVGAVVLRKRSIICGVKFLEIADK